MRRLRRAHQKHVRQRAKRRKKFKTRAIAAGTAAAITLGAGVSRNYALAAYTPDEHELPVSQDADADLLANKEELAIGYRVFEPDQNRNETPDGVELAKRCAADINELPWQDDALPGETYKWGGWELGLEICDICGATVNMGDAGIVNPQLGLSVDCPLIAIHYMEHGSFGYGGNVHSGRLDVPALLRALELRFPYDPNDHQLPLDYVVESVGQLAPDANDLDTDLLADSEELEAGYNLYDPDQDQDLTPDGIELAKRCAAIINQLPWGEEVTDPNETYKWCEWQLGLQACDICGGLMGMGPGGIVNPRLGINVECNINMAIHYMEHGSFSYLGVGAGRIDVPALMKVLEMPQRCGDLGTMYLPGDLNKDCKVDFTDFAEFADKWLDSTEPSQGGQGELAEPGMTYQIADECATGQWQMSAMDDGLRFSVTIEGRYIHFEDMMVANCCPDELWLEMTVEDNLITIYEVEYTPGGCWCICDFPVMATLGPFEPGTYTLDVYWVLSNDEDMGGFIGSTTVTIGPAG